MKQEAQHLGWNHPMIRTRINLALVWTLILFAVTGLVLVEVWLKHYGTSMAKAWMYGEGFRVERPWAGLMFIGLPFVFYVQVVKQRQDAPKWPVTTPELLALASKSTWKLWFVDLPVACRVVSMGWLVFAMMGPQSIHAKNDIELSGIDLMLTLDCSGSMRAQDVAPTRFEATKEVVDDFISKRTQDRMGAVIFARDAFTLYPLSVDKRSLRQVVGQLELDQIDSAGTAIGNALGTSLNRLRKSKAKTKAILLLTDGDSNSGNISPIQAAEYAKTMGVKVYTVLMGETDETTASQGQDLFGSVLQRVRMPINPSLLRQIADTTGGQAYTVSNRKDLEQSFHQILDQLERTKIADAGRYYGELYPPAVWVAAILLLVEVLWLMLALRRWP